MMWMSGYYPAVLVFFVSSVLIGCSVGERNLTRKVIGRHRRQADCSDGFRCRNGECIDIDLKCDGKLDCSDRSDETESCKELQCRGNIFRCKYGACISKKFECDGKKDCWDGSDENNPNCANSKNPKCKSEEFQCLDKKCINIDNKCDGTPDCADLSDETEETCLNLRCPGHTFKCKYGACISRKRLCNGINDCFDGSDESAETCDRSGSGGPFRPTQAPVTPSVTVSPPSRKKRPPNVFRPGSCTLPRRVQNGAWTVLADAEYDYQPGDLVEPGTTIQVNCQRNHVVLEAEARSTLSICMDSVWSIRDHNCIEICQPIETPPNTIVTCYKGNTKTNCKAPTEGTTAYFRCPQFFELTTFKTYRTCSDGTWDDDRPHCEPVCGEESVTIKELIIGGQKVKKGYYPWTIALYKRDGSGTYKHVCGGSLISERVIVTAAHCVADPSGKPREKELYKVAAGKYFRTYNHPNDTDAEFQELEQLFVYTQYLSSTLQYEGDIALLVTKEPFNTTLYIQRICMDWDPISNYEPKLLGQEGVVTGWGYTQRGIEPSEVLKYIFLPYVDFRTCYDGTPSKYQTYIRGDKMCAGYLNKGVGVCEGDSGGGLAFRNLEHNNRFYLRGIVSVAPQVQESCDEYRYAFYTKVHNYINFIQPIVQQYTKRQKN